MSYMACSSTMRFASIRESRNAPGYYFGNVYEVKPKVAENVDGTLSLLYCVTIRICEFEQIDNFKLGSFLNCFGIEWLPFDNEPACVDFLERKYRERRRLS